MVKNTLLNRIPGINSIPVYLKQYLFNKVIPESVYFYTFHKCASTLFSVYVLKNIKGLQYINYASSIYYDKKIEKLAFKERGYVYGPIRLSADKMSPVYDMLIRPTSQHEFIKDKIAIFFVRDPRDILVSAYYSFGYTHGLSPVKKIRELEEATRAEIQRKTLDEYVLDSASDQSKNFKVIYDLSSMCERSVIIKYEDMINNFDFFIAQLRKYIVIDETCVQEIYKRSRPKQSEDKSSHRRSGQVGAFRNKLKKETIRSINGILRYSLVQFGYEA